MRSIVLPRMAILLLVCAAAAAAKPFNVTEHVAPMWRAVRENTRVVGDLSTVRSSRPGDAASAARVRRRVDAVKNTTECEIRLLAYEYALKTQPERAPTKMVEVFDALQLHDSCGLDRPTPAALPPPSFPPPATETAVFVDPAAGSDSAAGTEAAPFATVERALAATRAPAGGAGSAAATNPNPNPKPKRAIVLRAGVHFLARGINLTAADSGLLLTNYPGEEAWLSGGVPLKTSWTPFNVSGSHLDPDLRATSTSSSAAAGGGAPPAPAPPTPNVWVTDIDPAVADIPGLMTLQTHRRLTRARFPNAQPEDRHTVKNLGGRDGLLSYVAPPKRPAARHVWHNVSNATVDGQGRAVDPYDYSILKGYNGFGNGHCDKPFDPACVCGSWRDVRHGVWSSYSYHCANASVLAGGWENEDGGNGYYNGPILPLGLRYNTSAGSTIGDRAARWSSPEGGIVVAWRAQGWFVNFYEISAHDKAGGVINWTDAHGMPQGGWQGGRGWQLNGTTGAIDPNPPFYVENIFEELDAPDEWYFDAEAHKLYLWHNDTSGAANTAPPKNLTFVATSLAEMVGVRGTMDAPARDITIRGIGFRDAAATVMHPWGVPSGGDWALYRGGAVFVEGAERVNVTRNTFRRVDGNALTLSGYTRDVRLEDNDFSWIGDCAMATWGYTLNDDWDGTAGEQPRGTVVRGNYARELGIYQLQSSMLFMAKTALTTVEDNVFFNGPRSGINFNDGFGGGHRISRNLVFNQCRQSGDHGPLNSWDRQPFLTDVRYGKDRPSYEAADSEVNNNFIIANYGGSQGFDNDDGSSWYNIHDNFIYGEGLKQDYGGHDSRYTNNVNVVHHYDGQNCFNTWPFLVGHEHNYTDNTCVVLYTWQYGSMGQLDGQHPEKSVCNASTMARHTKCALNLARNKYYTPYGNATVNKDVPFAKLQSGGVERGSSVASLPSNDAIIAWGREKLDM